MAFLRKRETGIWYLVDKSGGKAKWIKLGSISKAEATTVLSRYNIDQTYLKLDLQSDSSITFEECAKEYLAWAKTFKAATTTKYEACVLNVFNKTFKKRRLAGIETFEFEAVWAGQRPNAVRLKVALLRQLYKFAMSKKYVSKNIALELKRPSVPILPPRHVDPAIIVKILNAMPPATRIKFQILYYTGMRPSEVLRLQARDIDLATRKITVRFSKTNRFRMIPIHKEIAGHLSAMLKNKSRDAYLFPARKGGHQTSLRDGLRKACERIKVSGVSPYTFRHTFATTVLEKTRDIRAVQQLLGHATIQMTTRYATALDNRLREAVDSI